MQNIKGNFDITFLGIPILFVSKSVLTPENGKIATVYAIHITPFFSFGFTIKKIIKPAA